MLKYLEIHRMFHWRTVECPSPVKQVFLSVLCCKSSDWCVVYQF